MSLLDSELIGETTRCLSKSGEIYSTEELKKLALTPEQVVELYCFFRDNSQRWESEWRDQFIAIFPDSEPYLPQVAGADAWQTKIFEVIDSGQLEAMKEFLTSVGTLSMTFEPASAYEEGRTLGFGAKADYVPFAVYPVQVENEDGVSTVEYARNTGHEEIAGYLEAVISDLEAKWKMAYGQGYALANGG
jgi:hypothetical protein